MCVHKICVKTGAASKFSTPGERVQYGFGVSSNGEMFVLSFVIIGRLVEMVGTSKGYFCLFRKNSRLKFQSASDVALPLQFNLETGK